jgi:hypothetical protein
MSYEFIHSWFTISPVGIFFTNLKTFIAEDASGIKFPDDKFHLTIQLCSGDGKEKGELLEIKQLSDPIEFKTSHLMDYFILSIYTANKKAVNARGKEIVSKKLYLATLIGNVATEDTSKSQINHKFKLTDDGKREILFHLSFGSRYEPQILDVLK